MSTQRIRRVVKGWYPAEPHWLGHIQRVWPAMPINWWIILMFSCSDLFAWSIRYWPHGSVIPQHASQAVGLKVPINRQIWRKIGRDPAWASSLQLRVELAYVLSNGIRHPSTERFLARFIPVLDFPELIPRKVWCRGSVFGPNPGPGCLPNSDVLRKGFLWSFSTWEFRKYDPVGFRLDQHRILVVRIR